jgi:hypothetical protein
LIREVGEGGWWILSGGSVLKDNCLPTNTP